MCVGCRARRPASELVRVHLDNGDVVIGPGPGRGAWICPRQTCIERALERGRLRRALHVAPDVGVHLDDGVREVWRRVIAGRSTPSA